MSPPTVRLREGATDVLRSIFGCRTDGEVADRIGIDPSQLSRIQRWRSGVGPVFMARLLLAAKDAVADRHLDISDLFEIVTETGETVPLCVNCPAHMPLRRSA